MAGARADAWTARTQAWLRANERRATVISTLVFGVILTVDGLLGLLHQREAGFNPVRIPGRSRTVCRRAVDGFLDVEAPEAKGDSMAEHSDVRPRSSTFSRR